MKLSVLAPIIRLLEVWTSVTVDSVESYWPLGTMHFSICWHCSGILPLIVDNGKNNLEAIACLILHIQSPHWNSLGSWEWPGWVTHYFCQYSVYFVAFGRSPIINFLCGKNTQKMSDQWEINFWKIVLKQAMCEELDYVCVLHIFPVWIWNIFMAINCETHGQSHVKPVIFYIDATGLKEMKKKKTHGKPCGTSCEVHVYLLPDVG